MALQSMAETIRGVLAIGATPPSKIPTRSTRKTLTNFAKRQGIDVREKTSSPNRPWWCPRRAAASPAHAAGGHHRRGWYSRRRPFGKSLATIQTPGPPSSMPKPPLPENPAPDG